MVTRKYSQRIKKDSVEMETKEERNTRKKRRKTGALGRENVCERHKKMDVLSSANIRARRGRGAPVKEQELRIINFSLPFLLSSFLC